MRDILTDDSCCTVLLVQGERERVIQAVLVAVNVKELWFYGKFVLRGPEKFPRFLTSENQRFSFCYNCISFLR